TTNSIHHLKTHFFRDDSLAHGNLLGVSDGIQSRNPSSIAENENDIGPEISSSVSVSESTSLEALVQLFSDPKIETQNLHDDQGQFVGVVTRQSLLEAMLKEVQQSKLLPPEQSDITHKHSESLLVAEREFLECILTSKSQDGGLTELVQVIESLTDGMICSILLVDETGLYLRSGAAVSLHEEYVQAVDGLKIGPSAGSCGTAAFLNQSVVVIDIANDPLWTNFREIALAHNLRS
ncbi:MAG: hypothetical protein ACKVH8_22950, partial [Pirellulales bacterium]